MIAGRFFIFSVFYLSLCLAQASDWIYEDTKSQCLTLQKNWASSVFNQNTLSAGLISTGKSLKLVLFMKGSTQDLQTF